jgi:hypothetical protein
MQWLDAEADCSDDDSNNRRHDDDDDGSDVETAEDKRFIDNDIDDDDNDNDHHRAFHGEWYQTTLDSECSMCGRTTDDNDRATTNNTSCSHSFCFMCLHHWAKVRPSYLPQP